MQTQVQVRAECVSALPFLEPLMIMESSKPRPQPGLSHEIQVLLKLSNDFLSFFDLVRASAFPKVLMIGSYNLFDFCFRDMLPIFGCISAMSKISLRRISMRNFTSFSSTVSENSPNVGLLRLPSHRETLDTFGINSPCLMRH